MSKYNDILYKTQQQVFIYLYTYTFNVQKQINKGCSYISTQKKKEMFMQMYQQKKLELLLKCRYNL